MTQFTLRSRMLSFVLICAIILSAIPLPVLARESIEPASPVLTAPPKSIDNSGSLRYPIELDGDADPASNPGAVRAVPVARFGDVTGKTAPVIYAEVQLGVAVVPDNSQLNPADTLVTFHLWNNANGAAHVDLTHAASADAWGAALASILIDEAHLSADTPYFYQASAPGYGQTEVRSFTFDLNHFSSDTQLGAATLTTEIEADGRLILDITTDQIIDDLPLAAQVMAAKLVKTATVNRPQIEPLPLLVARRLDDHHARAEVYLDAGEYALLATIQAGDTAAHSLPARVMIPQAAAPRIQAVENIISLDADGRSGLVQYRTSSGDVAIRHHALNDLPQATTTASTPASRTFEQVTRLSAFKVLKENYQINFETVANDGQKTITLDDFHYDPIERRYDLTIQSRQAQPIEDKLTVQIFGPNKVVIDEETVPIQLFPDRPFHYSIGVPTDRGEPYGLRVIVHDPAIIDGFITKAGELVMTVFTALRANAGAGVDLSLGGGLKAEFKVVEILIASASIACQLDDVGCRAPQYDGLIFQSPELWLDTVSQGVRDFLRNNFGVKSIEESAINLAVNGLPLGSLTLAAYSAFRATYTLDVSCLTDAQKEAAKVLLTSSARSMKDVIAMINFKAKPLLETFQRQPWPEIPINTFLAVQLAPVFAFSMDGGSDNYSLYVEMQFQVGVGGSVILKPLSFVALAGLFDRIRMATKSFNLFFTAFEIARLTGVLIANLSAANDFNKTGGELCRADPPNGHPDDRRDAVEDEFLVEPTGASGDIAYAQQQVATARRLGLARAEVYWLLRLRRAELAAFDADTSKRLAEQAEVDTAQSAAETRIQGLISGTIALSPSQTITDAVMSTYTDFMNFINYTPRDQERRTYLNALEFVQGQYTALRGQELELQRELRVLTQGLGVGVIDEGLATWTLAALGSVGAGAVPVQLVRGIRVSGLPNSRYYSPYEAPSVLIAPSGSLHRFVDSDEARAWLDAYTSSGGTLIVLAQSNGQDWSLLPGGQVSGLGYEEDILCKTASVRIVNPSEWLVGLNRDLPDLQIDGSFTSIPEQAKVVLMRTTGNQMPAMIEYAYGDGYVVATSAYPDFYLNGLQSTEDLIFARSLFGLAHLKATGESMAQVVNLNQLTSYTWSFTNTAAITATAVQLSGDWYGQSVADAWRWSRHPLPGAPVNSPLTSLVPPLPSGEARTVTMTFKAPDRQAGLYRMGYFLMTPQTRTYLPGPFYQVRSTASGLLAHPLTVQLMRDRAYYNFGDTATVTATLTNGEGLARTLTLTPQVAGAVPITITLNPSATLAVKVYQGSVLERRVLHVDVAENSSLLSQPLTTLELAPAHLGLTFEPEHIFEDLSQPLTATMTAQRIQPGTPITFELLLDNIVLQTQASSFAGDFNLATATAAFNLGSPQKSDQFVVRATTQSSLGVPLVIRQTIRIEALAHLGSAAIAVPLQLGAVTPNALHVLVTTDYVGAVLDLQSVINTTAGVPLYGPVKTATLSDTLQIIPLDAALPSSVNSIGNNAIAFSGTIRIPNTLTRQFVAGLEAPLNLAGPQVSAPSNTLTPKAVLNLTLAPHPDSALATPALPYTVTLRSLDVSFQHTVVLTGSPQADGSLPLSLTVPSLPVHGLYRLDVQTAPLIHYYSSAFLRTPDRSFTFNAPNVAPTGHALNWTITSAGDLPQPITVTLQLIDPQGIVVAHNTISGTPAGGTRTLSGVLPVPAQLVKGQYRLRWQGTDDLGLPIEYEQPIDVTGFTSWIIVQTDRAAYASNSLVNVTTTIHASGALTQTWVRLQVAPQSSAQSVTTSTLAGALSPADGITRTARLSAHDLVYSHNGDFALITEQDPNVVRRLDLATGTITTIAGGPLDAAGNVDAIGLQARFGLLDGLSLSPDDSYALIADSGNHTIRRLDLNTLAVTTLVHAPDTNYPTAIAISQDGTFALFTDAGYHTIERLNLATNQVTTLAGIRGAWGLFDGIGQAARFTNPNAIALNSNSTIAYLYDSGNRLIRRLDVTTGAVSTLNGAWLDNIHLAVSADGASLLVSDETSHAILQMSIATLQRQVIAGQLNVRGDQDGVGSAARFDAPGGLSLSPDGQTALLAHQSSVRRLDLTGPVTVTTVVGQTGYNYDGVGATADFETVPGLAVSPNGAYALAIDTQSLRRIDLATGVVTTVAGVRSLFGTTDGYTTTARFWGPDQIAFSPDGAYALITNGSSDMRRYNALTGEVTTITPQPTDNYHLRGIAISHDGTFALATDWIGDRIVRIDLLTNEITTIAGDALEEGSRDGIGTMALFHRPAGIALSPDDSLALITDYENHTIRRLELATLEVRTLAGTAGQPGTIDGVGAEVRFENPFRIAISPDGAYALVTTDGSTLDAVRRVDVATGRVRTLLQQTHAWDSFHSIVWFNAIAFEANDAALVAQSWNGDTRLLRLNLSDGLGPVLREDWIPVTDTITTTHNLTFTLAFTNPNVLSDPRARGMLAVNATLFGVEPTEVISPALHHQLGAAQDTFSVYDNQALILQPDQAEFVQVNGVYLRGTIINTATTTSQIAVTVTRDSTTILTQTFALAPNEVRNFTVNDFDPPLGEVTYVAQSSKGSTAVTTATVLSALVVPELRFVPPSVALGEETQLQIKLSNATSTAGQVYIYYGGDQDDFAEVPAGQTVLVSSSWIFNQAGVITVPIEFVDAVNGFYDAVVYVGDEVPTTTVELTGALHSSTSVAQTDQAAVNLLLNNSLEWGYGTVVSYTLVGPQNRSGAAPLWLQPGVNSLPIDLSGMPLGAYSIHFEVQHARLHTALATTSFAFDLVEPRDDLSLNSIADPIDSAGNVTYTIGVINNPGSDRTFSGVLSLAGAVEAQIPVTVTVGQIITHTGSINVLDRSGAQVIDIALTRVNGTPLVTRTLTINAAPRLAPNVTLTNLQAHVTNDGTTDIVADLDNADRAGDATLTLLAFDEAYAWLAPVSANGTTHAHYNVPAPVGVLSGTYPIEVRLADRALRTDVFVPGPQIDLIQMLDQPIYQPNSTATWKVIVKGISGAPATYDVRMRYRGEEQQQPITLGAGDTVTATWTFAVGSSSDRATVVISTDTLNGGHNSVAIDSRWINVVEDDRAYVTADHDRYDAGDTVQLTLHLTPTALALVFAPTLGDRAGDLIWSSLNYSGTEIVSGTYHVTYTLPPIMSTGRYAFRYFFDGEQRTYPIDVFGYEGSIEGLHATLGNGLKRAAAATPLHVAANVRVNQALNNAVISAYALTPDGQYLDLGSSATITTNLASGVTPIDLAGVLNAGRPGLYRIVLDVRTADQTSLQRESIYLDAGSAVLSELTLNKGLYTPNETAQGQVTMYGQGSAQLSVKTSDGTSLLQQTLTLTGFQRLNFAAPTNTERDEVVIATLTDTLGMTSTLQIAYKVAATLDVTAPQVAIVSPANGSVVRYANGDHLVTVTGIITEDRVIDQVLINGEPAAITGNAFTTTVPLNNGANLFEVIARDQAGNLGLGKLYTLYGEPSFGVKLSADPVQVKVGGTITFTAQITSSDLLTATVLFPFSRLHPNRMAGTVTTGTLVLTDTIVSWMGLVSPAQPVMVQWRSTVTQTMTQTTYAVVQSAQMLPRKSGDILIDSQPAAAPYRIYLPLVRR